MKHIEGTFTGFGDVKLYYQSWHPETQVQAVVALVHGLGAHSDLFKPVVDYLLSQNYEVFAFDLRGHGRSPGKRGHINTWAEYREDLRSFLKQVYELRAGCSCFLWGHSLGGTIALDFALRSPDQLSGLIVSAPALKKVSVPPLQLTAGWLLSRISPSFSLKVGLPPDVCSRDPEICTAYLQDPLRHEYGTARLATEFFATVNWIYKNTGELQIPLLILHGSADEVAHPEASRLFFQQVMFPDKEHHEYPDCYHDLYASAQYQTIFEDLDQWLGRHIEETGTCQAFAFGLS